MEWPILELSKEVKERQGECSSVLEQMGKNGIKGIKSGPKQSLSEAERKEVEGGILESLEF